MVDTNESRVVVASLLALLMSTACRPDAATPPAEPTAVPSTSAVTTAWRTQPLMASPPQIHADLQRPCDTGDHTTMSALMSEHLNGRMTEISFLLHHDDRDVQERMSEVTDTTALLLSCIQAIPDFRSQIPLERRSEYYQLMSDLQADAFALHLASMELDESAAHHWFYHLKQDCNACHARFRPAS